MKLPPSDSPIWYLLKLLVIGGMAALLLTINYANGFDAETDIKTILGLIVTLAGVDGLAKVVGVMRDGP